MVKQIEIFRVGTHTSMNGTTHVYDKATLQGIAKSYDPQTHEAPVVVGHPKTDSPAYGWVKALRYNEDRQSLVADVDNVTSAFEQAVKDGHYKKISVALYPPKAHGNPTPEGYHLRHVGFLGGMPPAVKGLAPVQFAGDAGDLEVIEFAQSNEELATIAGIFRKLRDWIIEKEGRETANNLVPDWQLSWLEDKDARNPDEPTDYTPENHSENHDGTHNENSKKEKNMSEENRQKTLEKREGALHAQKQSLEKERQAFYVEKKRNEAEVFAQTMVQKGTLNPCQKDAAIHLLVALHHVDNNVHGLDFGEGKTALASAFQTFLEQSPPAGLFSQMTPEEEKPPVMNFDKPRDYNVEGVEHFNKAQAYAQENNMDIVTASQHIGKE